VVLAADYPFMDVLWTMIIFFAWVAWIWMLIVIFTDVFRRRDIGGWAKAAWIVFMIVLPFLGVLVYLIAQHDGMAQRQADAMSQAQQQTDEYIRSVATNGGGAADQIAKGKELLDSGAISQAEFDSLKARALGAA
jgi:general stress protein CsbA